MLFTPSQLCLKSGANMNKMGWLKKENIWKTISHRIIISVQHKIFLIV